VYRLTASADISGVPGIGKTALVRKVVDELVQDPRQRTLTVSSYYINALELKKPEDLYGCMLVRMFKER
jgi:Cdc6-like AAA superfamily ATPase